MFVYFGENVTVTVQGQAWRTEKCEHCGQQFHYRVAFATGGVAINPYFLDSHGAPRRAEEAARDRLDHALRYEVFPVPCPYCNLYQPGMVPRIQAEQYPRMLGLSRFLLGAAPTIAFVSCVSSAEIAKAFGATLFHPAAVAVWVGLPVLVLAAAVWVRRDRRRRQAAYDPNAEEYAEARRSVAAKFALKPEEFAQLQLPPSPAPGVRLGSPRRGQLVGQNCVRCGGRIPDELDSRFCNSCGLPVHNRCAAPTEGGWCPVCGAASPK